MNGHAIERNMKLARDAGANIHVDTQSDKLIASFDLDQLERFWHAAYSAGVQAGAEMPPVAWMDTLSGVIRTDGEQVANDYPRYRPLVFGDTTPAPHPRHHPHQAAPEARLPSMSGCTDIAPDNKNAVQGEEERDAALLQLCVELLLKTPKITNNIYSGREKKSFGTEAKDLAGAIQERLAKKNPSNPEHRGSCGETAD